MNVDIQEMSYIFIGVCSFALAVYWFPLWRLYRRFPLDMAYLMWKLQSRSLRGVLQTWSLYFALIYILKDTVWRSLDEILPPIPLCFVLGGVITFIGYSCLPPSVLFLAASRPDQRSLAINLVRAFRPYRVVYLLSDDRSVGIYDHEDFTHNNLRTPDEVDWRSVVHPLMDIVPTVAIDARVVSPAVVEEIQRMVANGNIGKCVFIVGPSGTCPAIDQAVSDSLIRANLQSVPDSQLIPFVKKLVRDSL